jgi:hypothetical protein
VINKFNDILEQFAREIDTTVEIFEKHKDTPPVTKNQPPVAGDHPVHCTSQLPIAAATAVILEQTGCARRCAPLVLETAIQHYPCVQFWQHLEAYQALLASLIAQCMWARGPVTASPVLPDAIMVHCVVAQVPSSGLAPYWPV